ncbi:MAG: FAD-dependent oxidoreductase [Myxococcaceae bacterium]
MTRLTRRTLLSGLGASAVTGVVGGCASTPVAPGQAKRTLELRRPRASPAAITQITVCTRPFRPQGPRIELEQIGSTAVIHNYGHGGSGWSLSWGSSALAAQLALGTGQQDIAVIGCGALGITSALLLQRAGAARVTIYARDLPPNVRSSLASGVWSPDSRICLEAHASAAFKSRWQAMARTSFQAHQTWLGLADRPVEFIDQYVGVRPHGPPPPVDPRPRFARSEPQLLEGITPGVVETFAPGTHPLGDLTLRQLPTLMYNLTAYSRLLMSDFLARGGQIEVREFQSPSELSRLRQRTVINATGYGARALFGDTSLVPVRGQLARTPTEPDISYGLVAAGASFVPRRDGFVFQILGPDEYYGYGDDTAVPDRAEAERAVQTITGLFVGSTART